MSRQSDISVSAYLRTSPQQAGQNHYDMGNDLLVARVDLTPSLDGAVSWHRLMREQNLNFTQYTADRWYSATAGSGEFRLVVQFKPSRVRLCTECGDLADNKLRMNPSR